MLEVESLKAGYGKGKEIVHDVSFALDEGEFCCIIGANGCGKTTTLKTILGLIPALGGHVLIDGVDASTLSERERAKRFAYIPQMHRLPFPFQVKDVVLMGRAPYMKRMATISRNDRRIAFAALCQLSIEHLADAPYTELSGGQQQLVLIARALTQQSDVLIMDEPTASLDFGNQQLVLSRMRSLVDCGMSVLMVTHDPTHAFYCASHVIVMHDGQILEEGSPVETITAETMRTIYNTEVKIEKVDLGNERTGCTCIPIAQNKSEDDRFMKELMRGRKTPTGTKAPHKNETAATFPVGKEPCLSKGGLS
jgi:iron complex transport system ATP-binding protein